MLIELPEHDHRDLAAWRRLERMDPIVARSELHRRRVARSVRALLEFASHDTPAYCGVSWGKDSVVVAHMVIELARMGGPVYPLVWVKVEPVDNPHCPLVRDAFLAAHNHPYHEIVVELNRRAGKLTSADGFALAAERHGPRHVSGVRASESSARAKRCAVYGESTSRTCAPLAWWTAADVFAYLHYHRLPVHPAYAMSLGGKIDRGRLRVSSLGGERGTGHGRREWEQRYYPEKMRELGLL